MKKDETLGWFLIMGCVSTGYIQLFRKNTFSLPNKAACQLLKEESEKNFAQSGTHFYVA